MAKGRPRVEDPQADKIPSLAVQDPTMRLAAGVAANALLDLRGADLVQFLDALTWLICGDAPIFFEAIGYDKSHEEILSWIVKGNHAKRTKITLN